MKGLLFLLFTRLAVAALTIACGSPTDTGSTGGAAWPATGTAADKAIMGALPVPFSALRYSAPPGVAFSYIVVMPPNTTGRYRVKLGFLEPNKVAAGQRIFSVSANGSPVITGLDLFAAAGLLKPYDQSFVVTAADGRIVLNFAASVGNAVISSIQIDTVDTPSPVQSVSKGQCEDALATGNGVGALGGLFPASYAFFSCTNLSGFPMRITRFICRTDVAGQVADVMARGSDGLLHSLLVSPVVCTPDGAEGSVLPGASYNDKDVLWWFIRIVIPTNPGLPLVNEVLLSVVREQ